MSGWLLPALVLMAALAATSVCCLRPMRGGGCHRTPALRPMADDDLQSQLLQARAELHRLRAQ